MNMTCDVSGIVAVCDEIVYANNTMSALCLAGVLVILTLLICDHKDRRWRRALTETGHEQAWLDIVKAKEVFRVPKKDERIGGDTP